MKCILVVDDDALLGRATNRYLAYFLRKLREAHPDLVETVLHYPGSSGDAIDLIDLSPWIVGGEVMLVTDFDMPGRNGLELAAELRRRLGDRLKRVVVMTGNVDPTVERDIREAGHGFIAKPASLSTLEPYILSFLDLKPDTPNP